MNRGRNGSSGQSRPRTSIRPQVVVPRQTGLVAPAKHTASGGTMMAILTPAMKRVVREERLGYIATVCPDCTPNLSPKGTTTVWDDDHLVFADICSPGTIENLRHNPAIEINVVDPVVRKGYRFKGRATVLDRGPRFSEIMDFYRNVHKLRPGLAGRVRHVVLVRVERVLPL